MNLLFIDFETFSNENLKQAGVYKYAESPLFEVLMMGFAHSVKAPPGLAVGERNVLAVPGITDEQTVFVAHNANFERVVLSRILGLPPGEYLPPERFIDTQAIAAQLGLPQKLETLARVLGVEQKDSAGTRLINLFSAPSRRGTVGTEHSHQEDWKRFGGYCRQDVVVLQQVFDRLVTLYNHIHEEAQRSGVELTKGTHAGFQNKEFEIWCADARINDRGVRADVALAQRAEVVATSAREAGLAQLAELTGLENPNSTAQLIPWLRSQGFEPPADETKASGVTLGSDALRNALAEGAQMNETVRRALELRLDTAVSSAAKFTAIIDRANEDERLRGMTQYYGAHTGRWAGRGVQLQNLPSTSFGEEDSDTEEFIERLWQEPDENFSLDDLKPLVRACLGFDLTVCDYSAIEARVLAWLAGEEWVLEAFRQGRDIYIETAARMFHVPYEEAKPLRKKGKVAVLALGYNGGIAALRAMGAEGTDEELREIVTAWRAANPNIARLWKQADEAFRIGYGAIGDKVTLFRTRTGTNVIALPSGRGLCYHQVRMQEIERFGKPAMVAHYLDPSNPKLIRKPTYGGKIIENITQAVARDLLAESLVRMDKQGVEVVAHVHDEVIVQDAKLEVVQELLGAGGGPQASAWAEGLPVNAEGYYCHRYRKG